MFLHSSASLLEIQARIVLVENVKVDMGFPTLNLFQSWGMPNVYNYLKLCKYKPSIKARHKASEIQISIATTRKSNKNIVNIKYFA